MDYRAACATAMLRAIRATVHSRVNFEFDVQGQAVRRLLLMAGYTARAAQMKGV